MLCISKKSSTFARCKIKIYNSKFIIITYDYF